MKIKPEKDEFVKGLLQRLSTGDDTNDFHSSVVRYAFRGVRARFKGLK
ncbi:MAG: hypothetical protein NTY73_03910 [Candidatus Micrarchaeota archaeon]|nr:hypothetical protein [Candidatus Micrarchaeota archaeon]